ncbi:hypothetical protein Pan216_20690 [Planctomycetes bacterium Pan216]|uniref:Uncharacterized protein n=1 Tax=Kolteria novifilia TaxID=2527975 RepID=A0A518B2M0_9BACT|nr:hypothetical protein Pan216_20690 [Planctomycetes bacterium Pan216]
MNADEMIQQINRNQILFLSDADSVKARCALACESTSISLA